MPCTTRIVAVSRTFARLLVTLWLLTFVASAQQTRRVDVGNNFFADAASANSTSTINVGDTIQWVWVAGFHTTTSGTCTGGCVANGLWNASIDGPGATFSRVFNTPGTFPYYCEVHGAVQQGTVIVQSTTAATTTVVTTSGSPSAVGASVTFTATVTSGGGTPAGNVTFKSDGVDIAGSPVALNGQGVATLQTSSLTVGTHSITAAYAGNASFSASTSSAISQVILNSTATALQSSANPAATGQSVTFTATVTSGGGTPAGNVTFKDGVVDLGAPVALNGQGVATLNTSALTAGPHSITAAYAGNAGFSASTSSAISQVVKINTTTALQSSATTSIVGQAVTFTATVTNAGAVATGSVSFRDNGVEIGTGTLDGSGVATFQTSALAAGGHPMTAVYAGDDLHFTSTSNTANLTVNTTPPPPLIFQPTSLDFGGIALKRASPARSLTLTNNRVSSVNTSTLGTTGDYSQTNDCGPSLAPSATCVINVVFTPQTMGTRPGSLLLEGGSVVQFTGSGVEFTFSLTRPQRPPRN